MRTTYILVIALVVAGAAAIVTGFILSKNGIILENYNALPGRQSQVNQNNMNQSLGSNNSSTAVEES